MNDISPILLVGVGFFLGIVFSIGVLDKMYKELMTIASQEARLNLSRDRVSKDFRDFIHSKEGELPNYVVMFLKKGKDEIDSIEEGPERPKNQVPPLF